MTWTRRWPSPNASPCCITARSSSRARGPKWSRIRAPRRSTLATDALAVQDVDTFYGDSHVLHQVAFALRPGRLLGLLGRNGAGKTTCMSTIMGFVPPRRGAITLFGQTVAGLAPEAIARKGIGLVPQGRRVFRTLTVRENLMVAARRRTGTERGGWSLQRVYQLFPRLEERQSQLARSLS